MVSKEPRCWLVQLFACLFDRLGLCKGKAENDVELNTLRGHDIPIIPPTKRTQTIVPESSAGAKTRKLSIALPSKKTKKERSTDLVNAWFENIDNAAQSSGNSGEPSNKNSSDRPEKASNKDTSDDPKEASSKDASDQPEEAFTKDVHSHSGEASNKDTNQSPQAI
ncbi:hypothetical protein NW768_003660 [Fusarium equiseti]|uniref:Uncharacterized protein n=1 Tax=Fusarium equiseti TaxID=61235 RepID=A0ABQ8RII7_FUSEQ|nr:hypothetical protein NW768_003660 [Fusarium equiseti]